MRDLTRAYPRFAERVRRTNRGAYWADTVPEAKAFASTKRKQGRRVIVSGRQVFVGKEALKRAPKTREKRSFYPTRSSHLQDASSAIALPGAPPATSESKRPSILAAMPFAGLAVVSNRLVANLIGRIAPSIGRDKMRLGFGLGMAAVSGFMSTRKKVAPKTKMRLQLFALGAGIDVFEAMLDMSGTLRRFL